MGGTRASGLGRGLTTPHRQKTARYEMLHKASCQHDNDDEEGNFLAS
jgi:hypothetical protein